MISFRVASRLLLCLIAKSLEICSLRNLIARLRLSTHCAFTESLISIRITVSRTYSPAAILVWLQQDRAFRYAVHANHATRLLKLLHRMLWYLSVKLNSWFQRLDQKGFDSREDESSRSAEDDSDCDRNRFELRTAEQYWFVAFGIHQQVHRAGTAPQ